MGAVTWRYMVALTVVAAGSSFQFYNLGVVNPPQQILEKWLNDTYYARNGRGFSSVALTLYFSFLSSSIEVGAVIGALLTKKLAETFGRRNALVLNGIVNVVGGILEGISKSLKSPELLLLGRIILGACMGLSSGLAPLYLTEITPVRYRGAAGTAHQIAVAFGDWFSLLMAMPQLFGEDLWPIAFSFAAIPALILVIVLPMFPESPKYLLISLRKREEAIAAVRTFVGDEHYQAKFDEIQREAAVSYLDSSQVSVRTLFEHRFLRTPLLIAILVMVAQQFTGCAAVFSYSTEMFIQASLTPDVARVSTLAIGICYFVFVLPSTYLIERLGRRWLSLFQLSGCCFCLILLSIFTALQSREGNEWASYGCIGALVLYMCIYGLGSPIPWLITSELFTQEFRSAAISLSCFTAWFWAFVIASCYLPFQQAVGPALSFLPFIIILSISIVFMAILLPETKNRTIEDIVSEFKGRARSLSRTVTFTELRRKISASPREMEPLLDEEEDEMIPSSKESMWKGYGSSDNTVFY